MFGNVNEILHCMKLDCDCVVQLRHQMFQGRNANYTLKRMKKDAAIMSIKRGNLSSVLSVHCLARMVCFLQWRTPKKTYNNIADLYEQAVYF